jgi:Phytanoyl-CoA dioxygenase (PhyH)
MSGPETCKAAVDENLNTLDSQGFVILSSAIGAACLVSLRAAFDAGVIPGTQWPVPRGHDWIHSQLDTDPVVQATCRLPNLIAGVRHILGVPFFLSQVEGREPRAGNPPQPLHRDGAESPGQVMAAMVWLDDYGPQNGATQIIPGSHRHGSGPTVEAIVIEGKAGDVLLFDPEVLHGATTNNSGERRRSLLISYAAATLREQHARSEALRNVRMDTSEIFG